MRLLCINLIQIMFRIRFCTFTVYIVSVTFPLREYYGALHLQTPGTCIICKHIYRGYRKIALENIP